MIDDTRPATTIGELDIHMRLSLRYIMDELKVMREKVDGMVSMLATKEELAREIAAVNSKIDGNSARSFWHSVTEIAKGIAILAAAGGVIAAVSVSVARALRL